MGEVLAALVAAGAGSCGAIILVLAARIALHRAFDARLIYWVWMVVPLVVVAAAIPVRPGATRIMSGGQPLLAHAGDALAALVVAISPWAGPVVWAWGCGAVLTALGLAVVQVRFVRSLGVLTARNGLRYATRTDISPGVMGLLRPTVIVPADFDRRYTHAERELILSHERMHVRRGDLLANALCTLLRCLLWFNPLAHWATSRFRFDQELACDAMTLSARAASARAYSTALLKTVAPAEALALRSPWRDTHPLTRRILNLARPPLSRRRRLLGAVLVATMSATLAAGAWRVQALQTDRTSAIIATGAAKGLAGASGSCPTALRNARLQQRAQHLEASNPVGGAR